LGTEEHRKRAVASVDCAVITVSDSRTEDTDESGKLIKELLNKAGHKTVRYSIVRDEVKSIQETLRECIEDDRIAAIIMNGGTGTSSRDGTIEAIQHYSERLLPGFGELFRSLSYEEVGAAAMLSRAMAFVSEGKAIFAIPGSPNAVKLATEKLISPELGHLISEIRR